MKHTQELNLKFHQCFHGFCFAQELGKFVKTLQFCNSPVNFGYFKKTLNVFFEFCGFAGWDPLRREGSKITCIVTLHESNSLPLKMDGWKMKFLAMLVLGSVTSLVIL